LINIFLSYPLPITHYSLLMPSNPETDFLPLADTDEFLPPISNWTIFGGMFVVAIIGLTLPLASVAKYKEVVKAQASIRPAGESRLVQAFAEGQVKNISVKENQSVNKGDAIATLDDSRFQNKKSQLQGNIKQGKAQLVQVNAQITALNSQISAETNRIDRVVASAGSELERRQRDYQDKQVITVAQVEEAQANVQSAKAALSAAQSKQNRYQRGAGQGAIAQDQLEEAILAVQQQKQAVAAAISKFHQTKATLNPSKAEVAIATEQIATEQASGEAALANLNREQKALVEQQIKINQQLESDRHELQQAEIDLSQTIITAPISGIVLQLNLRNPSQTVQPGAEIATIAPSYVPKVVKAAISPQDIGKLQPKQKVQMRVSACPYSDYGTLKGVVSEISRDTIKPQNNGSKSNASATANQNQKEDMTTAFYDVTIKPDSLTLGKGKANQCFIQLGMEGKVDIITREDTVLKFLLRKAKLTTKF
jgi:HlyD family type I secretion membrane fusion protein